MVVLRCRLNKHCFLSLHSSNCIFPDFSTFEKQGYNVSFLVQVGIMPLHASLPAMFLILLKSLIKFVGHLCIICN